MTNKLFISLEEPVGSSGSLTSFFIIDGLEDDIQKEDNRADKHDKSIKLTGSILPIGINIHWRGQETQQNSGD